MNRTLIEKVRCLLSNAALPYLFWVEAAMMACYLVNHSPSTAIEKKTPHEVWSGSLANYSVTKFLGVQHMPMLITGNLLRDRSSVCFLALNLVSRAVNCGVLRTKRSFIAEMLSLMRLLC